MRADAIRGIKLEVFQKQQEIIGIQSEVIGGLLDTLLMYMDAAEVDSLPEIAKINHAAQIKAEIEF